MNENSTHYRYGFCLCCIANWIIISSAHHLFTSIIKYNLENTPRISFIGQLQQTSDSRETNMLPDHRLFLDLCLHLLSWDRSIMLGLCQCPLHCPYCQRTHISQRSITAFKVPSFRGLKSVSVKAVAAEQYFSKNQEKRNLNTP